MSTEITMNKKQKERKKGNKEIFIIAERRRKTKYITTTATTIFITTTRKIAFRKRVLCCAVPWCFVCCLYYSYNVCVYIYKTSGDSHSIYNENDEHIFNLTLH